MDKPLKPNAAAFVQAAATLLSVLAGVAIAALTGAQKGQLDGVAAETAQQAGPLLIGAEVIKAISAIALASIAMILFRQLRQRALGGAILVLGLLSAVFLVGSAGMGAAAVFLAKPETGYCAGWLGLASLSASGLFVLAIALSRAGSLPSWVRVLGAAFCAAAVGAWALNPIGLLAGLFSFVWWIVFGLRWRSQR
jgi:hypothetical protein